MTKMEETMTDIKRLSEDVTEEHNGYVSALDRERGAEADLLALMLSYVVDALPAITSVVWAHYKGGEKNSDRYPWRGLMLAGGPERRPDGVITGNGLYVDEEGQLRVLSFSGMWTAREEEWVAFPTDPLTPREVIDLKWDTAKIAKTFSETLRQQANGAKAQVAGRAEERADKLDAVATLLGGP